MLKRNWEEANFQTAFGRWVRWNFQGSGVFELKVTEGTSIPFSALKEHQADALGAAKGGRLYWKIPDDSMTMKPFDCFRLEGVPAFVVVMFRVKDRAQLEFVMVPVEAWVAEDEASPRRSLTEERAKEIGLAYKLSS